MRKLFIRGMNLILLCLAIALLPTPTGKANDTQPRAWLSLITANVATNTYLLDVAIYPEEPQIGGEFFVLAFGHGKPCYDLEYDRTIDGQNILIEARLVGKSGVCGVDWAFDWGILERVSIRFITTHDGEVCPQPGEWTAEIRLVLIPEYWIESKSIAFTVLP